jgi:N-acetylglucosaminyldiphosphoundecaprenol N-acetyl-beta-D-mannosaminyltransferase
MSNQSISNRADVLGIAIEPLNMETALERVARELSARRKGYVCLIGVHGVMEAQRDPELAQIYAQASIRVPDGTPTMWVGQWQGLSRMDRVPGPDLMLEIFKRKEFATVTHFFYGGKEGVAEELEASFKRRFPWTRIVGTYTPPFRELTCEEEDSLAMRIRALQPDIIWIGISTPKQERFMRRFLPQLDTALMFGVGAAFDYHTGRIKDAPQWIKRAGLQWLHRLMQDPRRLMWRYLRNNPAFVWHIALQLTHLRSYPPVTSPRGYETPASASSER